MAPILGVTRRRRAPPKRRPRRDRRRRPSTRRTTPRSPRRGRAPRRRSPERGRGRFRRRAAPHSRRHTEQETSADRETELERLPTGRWSAPLALRAAGFAGRSELLRGALALVVGTSHRARERPERPGCAQGPILAGPGPRRAPVHSSKALERPLATARFAATRRLLAVSGVRATVAIPCRAARSSQRRHAEAKNDLPRPAAPLKCCRAELARRPVKTAGPDADA